MSRRAAMTAGEFRLQIAKVAGLSSIATIGVISAYLTLLLRLPPEQWWGFCQIVLGFFVILFALTLRISNREIAPILSHLAAVERGKATRESVEAAFASLARLPMSQFKLGLFWWLVGGLLVSGAMCLRYPSFRAFPAAVMVLAAGSGGFITSVFLYFVHKHRSRRLLRDLAVEVGDVKRRAQLVDLVPLRSKLFVAVTGVSFVTLIFAMCLSYVVSSRRLEARSSAQQAKWLARQLPQLSGAMAEGGDALAKRAMALEAEADELDLARGVVLIDEAKGSVVAGRSDLLIDDEIQAALAARRNGAASGDGAGMDSPNVFSWLAIPGTTSIAAAVIPWSEVAGGAGTAQWIFAGMLVFSFGVSFALARVLAEDVGAATAEIQTDVERLAAGDLSTVRVFESEDELGALARSFEQMSHALRETVARVAAAADRVEGTTEVISSTSGKVAEGAASQEHGVKQATALVEGVQKQVRGVAHSAQELNMLVEEASSSILEMGAAGEELNDTAGVLSSKVDEVTTSIEQMVRSVKQVSSHTESLADAAGETSSSMEEMASAMRQVDVTAEQTLRLSTAVIQSADSGRAKVQQTIEGMESIRAATEVAERVIRGLGARTKEIGAILDVIDDVADETNLLALNAAIIAAQAGDHGRAFSVVADEIKELADRVLASTKEIGALIRAVQEESVSAVGAIEQGAQSVALGVQLSVAAGKSLEEITTSSRDAGSRIQEIVQAVREQTKAAAHVVNLMERVNGGVGAIRTATSEQDRGNEVVFRSSMAMREVSKQLRGTTEEQARGGARIRESVDGVRAAAEAINRALQIQSESNAELVRFLESVAQGTAANAESSRRFEQVIRELSGQAEGLRQDVQRFQI